MFKPSLTNSGDDVVAGLAAEVDAQNFSADRAG
jgi:hypothetical protein